jgi:hypothetical protein
MPDTMQKSDIAKAFSSLPFWFVLIRIKLFSARMSENC